MSRPWTLRCVDCAAAYPPLEVRYRCDCGGTLDVEHDIVPGEGPDRAELDRRRGSRAPADRSGVWRYREWVLPLEPSEIVTRGEGDTTLYRPPALADYAGLERLTLKHEGENPTGSFKDRGMAVAISVAKLVGARAVACASTGNTSASLASYAALAGLPAFVFIPDEKVAYGKLSQALAYGAKTLQVQGDFDDTMRIVQKVCDELSIYLVNSINPFRIEGQKAIGFELLDELDWQVPDWIVMPGGNLGNSSAMAKGLAELHARGLIDRLPRLAVVQAAGADPLYRAWSTGRAVEPVTAETIATAIRIGAPVSHAKCLRGIEATAGVVTEVTDQEILDAKARVDASGIGAEPASCSTVAGIRKLTSAGVIERDASVVAILTGHLLKDPDAVVRYHKSEWPGFETACANPPVPVGSSTEAILEEVRRVLRPATPATVSDPQ